MKESEMKLLIVEMLERAGIKINGNAPSDIQVHDERLYARLINHHSLGLGEAYMDGWWNCERIDEMSFKIARAGLDMSLGLSYKEMFNVFLHGIFNFQIKSKSKEVAVKHYDLGNDLYEKMLGSTMNYSCGYWERAKSLDEAQNDKMELICRKLKLKKGDKLLDIGCGWGAFALYAAKNYQVEVVGTTISKEQKQYAEKVVAGHSVKILLSDYRDLSIDTYDKIVSIGMFEHVGYKNYGEYIDIIHKNLKPGGIFLLHTIGGNASYHYGDEWISKYIFPNGMLPSIAQVGKAIEDKFVMEDWHNFGAYYDKTLLSWDDNFIANWDELSKTYDSRFYRMWHYYLMLCAGFFRARKIQLWQIVLSKDGLINGYKRPDITKHENEISQNNVVLPKSIKLQSQQKIFV